jgi:hypothetical protein
MVHKANKKGDRAEREEDGENPFGIGAPADTTGLIFREITSQFCNALTECPTGTITGGNKYLMTNLVCTDQSFTLDGAKLNGNGFTITLRKGTISLRTGPSWKMWNWSLLG